jgi:hypothetical protein
MAKYAFAVRKKFLDAPPEQTDRLYDRARTRAAWMFFLVLMVPSAVIHLMLYIMSGPLVLRGFALAVAYASPFALYFLLQGNYHRGVRTLAFKRFVRGGSGNAL